MNKSELIDAVARTTGLSKSDIDRSLKGTLYNIAAALSRGEKVTFVGFGTFERRQRKRQNNWQTHNTRASGRQMEMSHLRRADGH